jgi:hypothetical protein
MKEEKFIYESPALEEAKFGQFISGESFGETMPDDDDE